jgi:uncharacterized membrane protein YecN with MAPEG domain
MKISDRTKNRIKYGSYGASFILISDLILQNNMKESLFIAIVFLILSLTLPPLFTFMSDEKIDNRYK